MQDKNAENFNEPKKIQLNFRPKIYSSHYITSKYSASNINLCRKSSTKNSKIAKILMNYSRIPLYYMNGPVTIKYYIKNCIFVNLFALLLAISLTMIRDKLINSPCWFSNKECNINCKYYIKLYYIIFHATPGYLYEFLLVYFLIFLPKKMGENKKIKIMFFVINWINMALWYLFTDTDFPKNQIYIGALIITLFFFFPLLLKKYPSQRKILLKKLLSNFFLLFFTYSHVVIVNSALRPIQKYLLTTFKINGRNIYQIVTILYCFLYELLFKIIFKKFRNAWSKKKNNAGPVYAKSLLLYMYSLRIGNIIYLNFSDWGIYIQYLGLINSITEMGLGYSYVLVFFFKFINKIYRKKNYNLEQKIFEIKNDDCFKYCAFHKLDFIFFYIPILMYFNISSKWLSMNPDSKITVKCTYLLNKDNNSYPGTLILFIAIDLIFTIFFFWYDYFGKKKIPTNFIYFEIPFIFKIFICISYQNVFQFFIFQYGLALTE